jgi:hypothetical protein
LRRESAGHRLAISCVYPNGPRMGRGISGDQRATGVNEQPVRGMTMSAAAAALG